MYIVLAQSDVTANALWAWLELFGESPSDKSRKIVLGDEGALGRPPGALAFQVLAERIERELRFSSRSDVLDEVTILVDCVRPLGLNPISGAGTWESTIAMLILAFPEVRWVFGEVVGGDEQPELRSHNLCSLLSEPHRDRLFDPTSLRNFVKCQASEQLTKEAALSEDTKKTERKDVEVSSFLALRKQKAAAIDEETSYALYHAYVAYRFGYCAEVVRSWALMEHLFAAKNVEHGFRLLIEDVNLEFPDKPQGKHLSDLRERAVHCPCLGYGGSVPLDGSDNRVLVTIGHSMTDCDRMDQNVRYLEEKKPGRCAFLLKPEGGMFDLWSKACLFKRLRNGSRPGQAPGFIWPTLIREKSPGAGHSAPGKLMLIAERLVRRAEALRSSASTTEECIFGALLATEALELLRYQTPTLAFQALELKHEFEAKAEVSFIGVGHHFDVKSRIDELERETRVASQFFKKERRRTTQLDILVSILNRLMLVFRESGMFDEEQYCLNRLRTYHRRLQFHVEKNPAGLVKNIVLGYAEFLIASLPRFVIAISCWGIIIFLMFMFLFDSDVTLSERATLSALLGATPLDGAVENGHLATAVSIFAAGLGIFHIGILIAYLYSAVSRK